jgi:uncharacterized protein YcfJ
MRVYMCLGPALVHEIVNTDASCDAPGFLAAERRRTAMRMTGKIVAVMTVLVTAACGRQEVPPPDRFDDLSWLDTLDFRQAATGVASPLEAGFAEAEPVAEVAPAPVPAARPAAARATSTAPRRTASASPAPRTSSSGTYSAPAPAPRTETVKNTGRDAAIGAGAGAVIGAVAGGKRHRVRGAIIGGAAGAVVGGVIGSTVNTKERVVYP